MKASTQWKIVDWMVFILMILLAFVADQYVSTKNWLPGIVIGLGYGVGQSVARQLQKALFYEGGEAKMRRDLDL